MSEKAPPVSAPWPVGDDETAARVRAVDWALTPLGAIETWPEVLKYSIDLVRDCQLPMNLVWGPERIQIYNQANQAFMGRKHPHAFGRPAREDWGEVWDMAEAIHRRVFAGEKVTLENHPWILLRNGLPEETYFTTYFTPIRDPTGAVVGELITAFETTEVVKARIERERIAEERLEQAARLRTAAELVGLGWSYWRPDSNDVEWDARTRALWGLSPDARVDQESAIAALHPDDRYRLEDIRVAARDPANPSYEAEYRVIGIEDGLERWIRTHGRTYEPDGPRNFVGGVLDITEQKRAELALRDREAKLQAAVDLVGLSVYSWDLNADVAEWDPRIRAIWGVAADVEVDSALARSAIHAEDLPTFDAAVSRAMDPDGDGIYQVEYRVIGIEHGVERWVSSYGKTRFADGKAVGFVGAVLDITDRKRDDERLRESQAQLAAILDQLPCGVGLFDNDGRVKLSNRIFFGGFDGLMPSRKADAEGPWRAFDADGQRLAPSRYPGVRALAGETVSPGVDFLHTAADGQERWTRVSAAPFRDETGGIHGAVTVLQDVDQERRTHQVNLMLIAELQHRTRNLIAVVDAVSAETLVSSASLEDFGDTFRSRLAALSRVQELLSAEEGSGASIRNLVLRQLQAVGAEPDGERVVVRGCNLVLPGKSVQILALALHELATNALKYGALSGPEGRLSVAWEVSETGGERRLALDWHERGAPVGRSAAGLRRKGFGRTLIEEGLPYNLDARTRLDFDNGEVRCSIEIPLKAGIAVPDGVRPAFDRPAQPDRRG